MAVEGELKGLDGITCEDCGEHLQLQVCRSNAGYYLGYYCDHCGPYSRETGYFKTREIAEGELAKEIPNNLRNTGFVHTDHVVEKQLWIGIAARSELTNPEPFPF